jgi:hypothetical protein
MPETHHKVLGRTENEWHNTIEKAESELERLYDKKRAALQLGSGDGEKIRELEEHMNVLRGTLIAAKQVLHNPPFNETDE